MDYITESQDLVDTLLHPARYEISEANKKAEKVIDNLLLNEERKEYKKLFKSMVIKEEIGSIQFLETRERKAFFKRVVAEWEARKYL